MDSERTNWNDNRLDHLSTQVDELRRHMDDRFDKQDARFDALQRSMIITLASILAAFGSALFAIQL